jgi:excisionase family DNA binding protein
MGRSHPVENRLLGVGRSRSWLPEAPHAHRDNRDRRTKRHGVVKARTATTEEVAAALRVKPATVRKYARERRLPYDTTPGGHRRFDVEEAVRALLGGQNAGDGDILEPEDHVAAVPYVPIAPTSVHTASTSIASVSRAPVHVLDTADEVADRATDTDVA